MSEMRVPFVLSRYAVPISAADDPEAIEFLYSSVSGALVRLSEELQGELVRMSEGHLPEDSELVRNGLAVDARRSEYEDVRKTFEEKRRSRTHAPSFTIAPTMDCNFGCEYCFESHVKGGMSVEMQDKVLRMIEHQVETISPAPPEVGISWFGGEPLMGLKAILRMMERLRAFEEKRRERGEGFRWNTFIVTNGYLLSAEAAQKLIDVGVTRAQVTLDGAPADHDQRRFLKGSRRPTFERIAANLAELPAAMSVLIRVNVDRSNVSGIVPLFEELARRGLLGRVNVQIARVEKFSDGAVPADMFTSREFSEVLRAVAERAAAEGWPLVEDSPSPMFQGVCQVDVPNSWVINWNGELRRCWAELGTKDGRVGTVDEYLGARDRITESPLALRDPFDDPACRECVFLPSCMGGCPKTRAVRRAGSQKECPTWKYNYEKVLRARGQREVAAQAAGSTPAPAERPGPGAAALR
jgi:uncharacterized protein